MRSTEKKKASCGRPHLGELSRVGLARTHARLRKLSRTVRSQLLRLGGAQLLQFSREQSA